MSLASAYPTFLALLRRLAVLFSPRRWCTWRVVRRVVLAIVIAATCIAFIYAVENWRGRRALAAFAREAAAAGVTLDLRELVPPPVPDELNLAKIAPFDLPISGHDSHQPWSELADRYQLRKHDDARFEDASGSWREEKVVDLSVARTELGEDLTAYLARFAALDDLRRSLLARPHLRYEHGWDDPFAILLPYIRATREIARLFAFHAAVAIESGETDLAVRDIEAVLQLANAMRENPFLISQLVASVQTQLAITEFWEGQRLHVWDQSHLAALERALVRPKPLESYHGAFKCELAAAATFLRLLADDRSAGVFPRDDFGHHRAWRFAPRGWLDQNIVSIGRIYMDEILPAIDPASRRVIRPQLPRVKESRHPYTFWVETFVPGFGGIMSTAGDDQATLDLARLACALEQYYLTNDSYPEALASIVDESVQLAALRDPLSGEPYRYRRTADGGFEIWGVGSNGVDDGGVIERSDDGRYDRNGGDLVWHIRGAAKTTAVADKPRKVTAPVIRGARHFPLPP